MSTADRSKLANSWLVGISSCALMIEFPPYDTWKCFCTGLLTRNTGAYADVVRPILHRVNAAKRVGSQQYTCVSVLASCGIDNHQVLTHFRARHFDLCFPRDNHVSEGFDTGLRPRGRPPHRNHKLTDSEVAVRKQLSASSQTPDRFRYCGHNRRVLGRSLDSTSGRQDHHATTSCIQLRISPVWLRV